ncbi:hypothetical protein TrLO_g10311 [Triparma laevis f. longispina]|uniref:Uncharacterized protein n=1 Tax=Triparma laevis f. longispina TaxID=1714387 RepID=A0A9W7EG79_9STRA|nr:hypothetical protein TrLO_g10311 [Triparma laevis f. longispina]
MVASISFFSLYKLAKVSSLALLISASSFRIYAGGLLYMLSVNFMILVFSYQVFDASAYLTQTEAWTGLSTITFLCLVSGGIALYYVPGSHKATFYKSFTFKEHVTTYCWNDCRYSVDHNHKITTDQQCIRAMIPIWVSKHYTPDDKIVAFYKGHWKDWCADPPDWFDEEFKSQVPEDLLAVVGETGGSEEPEEA